jgi:hypothetical protein
MAPGSPRLLIVAAGEHAELGESIFALVPASLVAAYWLRSDNRKHRTSVMIFESEEAARAAADIARSMPGGELVHLDSVEVREVVAQV